MTKKQKKSIPKRCLDYALDFAKQDEYQIHKFLYGFNSVEELPLKFFWNYFHVISQSDIRKGNKDNIF